MLIGALCCILLSYVAAVRLPEMADFADDNPLTGAVRMLYSSEYFSGRPVAFVAGGDDDPPWWISLVNNLPASRLILNATIYTARFTSINLVFLLRSRSQGIQNALEILPLNAKIPIIVVGVDGVLDLQSVIDSMWNFTFVNVLILLLRDEPGDILAYSYSPFRNPDNCSSAGMPILVNKWKQSTGWMDKELLFPRNSFLNLQECQLRCGTINVPWSVLFHKANKSYLHGVAVNVLNAVANKMNFTYSPQSDTDGKGWGEMYSNGSGIGLHADVVLGKADIGMGEFLPFEARYVTLDLTRPYKESCLTWAVPSGLGGHHSVYDLVFKEFSSFLWISLCVTWATLFFFIIFLVRSKHILDVRGELSSGYYLFLYMFGTFIGISRNYPLSGTVSRSTFAMWFVFSLVMSTAYVASLPSLLATSWAPKDLSTLQEVLDAKLGVAIKPNHAKVLKKIAIEDKNSTMREILRAVSPAWTVDGAVDVMVEHRNVTLFNVLSVLEYFRARSATKTGSNRIHVFKNHCAINYFGVPFIFKKGSVLVYHFDRYMEMLIEAGLVNQWASKYTRHHENKLHSRLAGAALSAQDLFGAFVLLFSGLLVAVLVFLVELLIEYRYFWREKRAPNCPAGTKESPKRQEKVTWETKVSLHVNSLFSSENYCR